MRFPLLSATLCFALVGWSQVFSWSPLPDMPMATANNAVTAHRYQDTTYVLFFGGIDTSREYSGIHQKAFLLNMETGIWRSIPDLPDTLGKVAAAASMVGDTAYIIGGYHVFSDHTELSSDRVHRFSLECMCYLPDGAPIPVPIDDQVQAVYKDSLIFVVTGWSNTYNVVDVQIYDPYSDQWSAGTSLPINPNYPVFGAAGEILGDTIYYYGGSSSGTFAATKTLRKGYINPNDPTDITWLPVEFLSQAAAYRPAAITYGDNVFWVGGSHISYNYDGLAYTNNQPVPPSDRILRYDRTSGQTMDITPQDEQVMDLRGIGKIAPNQWVVAGGMSAGPEVSLKTYLLELDTISLGVGHHLNPDDELVQIYSEVSCLNVRTEAKGTIWIYDSKMSLIHSERMQDEHEITLPARVSGVYFITFRSEDGRVYIFRRCMMNLNLR